MDKLVLIALIALLAGCGGGGDDLQCIGGILYENGVAVSEPGPTPDVQVLVSCS